VKKGILILLLLIANLSHSQINFKGLLLERTVSNFGKVEFWMSRVDSFRVTNTSDKTIYILKQKQPRDFEVKIPRLGISPGSTETIEVIYKPLEKGSFSRELKLYHSASTTPFSLKFKGEIIAFDPYAEMACPSFSSPGFQRHESDMKITIIDSLTGLPIEKALIELSKGEDYKQFYTNKEGVIKRKSRIGLFFVYTEMKGYKSKSIEHYFNPRRKEITLTLVPYMKEVVHSEIGIDKKTLPLFIKMDETITKEEFIYTPVDFPTDKQENLDFPSTEYSENNIVFLIDVSSSMRGKDRLELLKKSMIQLTYMLRSIDRVTVITYSDESQVVLKTISAKNKEEIIEVINALKASGSTFGGKAIRKAYKILESEFLAGGNNQIILATDGGFNGLGRSEGQLKRLVKRKAKKGLNFSTLAFGKNKRGKDLINELSIEGGGTYRYIKTEEEAETKLNSMIMMQSFNR
jgi:Mg-chelatase subunit ChlD